MDLLELDILQEMADTDVAAGDYFLVRDVSEQESPNGIKKILVSQAREALRLQAPTAFATDGAVTPTVGTATLTKGSAGAYTLAAPTAAQDGMLLIITSRSAFAHVVTATGLLEDGVTGGAKNTATFAAFVGASCMLQAINLKWHTISLKAVTVA